MTIIGCDNNCYISEAFELSAVKYMSCVLKEFKYIAIGEQCISKSINFNTSKY